jgi:hypothetical protein
MKKILLYSISAFFIFNAIQADWRTTTQELPTDIKWAISGFTMGYVTGLVPVAGQCACVFGAITGGTSKEVEKRLTLFLASIIAGHIAGIATTSILSYRLALSLFKS